MTGSDIALIITAVGSLCAAMASSAAVIIGAMNTNKLNRTAVQVDLIEKNTNSLTSQLVASTAVVSHAEGKAEGKTEAVAEQKGKRA